MQKSTDLPDCWVSFLVILEYRGVTVFIAAYVSFGTGAFKMTGGSLLHRLAAGNDDFLSMFNCKNNIISHMSFEINAAETLSLSVDQLRFALALIISVVVGAGLPFIRSTTGWTSCLFMNVGSNFRSQSVTHP